MRFTEIVSTQKIRDNKTKKVYDGLVDDELLDLINKIASDYTDLIMIKNIMGEKLQLYYEVLEKYEIISSTELGEILDKANEKCPEIFKDLRKRHYERYYGVKK